MKGIYPALLSTRADAHRLLAVRDDIELTLASLDSIVDA